MPQMRGYSETAIQRKSIWQDSETEKAILERRGGEEMSHFYTVTERALLRMFSKTEKDD